MKLFNMESIYNSRTDEWEERYWIDGKIADSDLYFFEMGRERDLEIEKLLKEIEIEDEECDFCDCPECTIERYVEQLVELTGGCPCCIKEILTDFMFDIIDHIVVESNDEEIEKEMRRFN